MRESLEILKASLMQGRAESPFVEWKGYFPRSGKDSTGKNAYARALTALANTTILHGRDSAYLFAGITDTGEIVGIDYHREDHRLLTDFLVTRTSPPVPVLSFEYISQKDLSKELQGFRVSGGIYSIEVGKPSTVPFRYSEDGRKYGAILIRRGENVAEADPLDLLELTEKIRLGASSLLSEMDKEILDRVAHDSQEIADSLKKKRFREASRVAYQLLISYDEEPLFLFLQHSPILLTSMIGRAIDPFALFYTTNGNRVYLSVEVLPKRMVHQVELTSIGHQISTWQKLGRVARDLLSEGPPPELRDLQGHHQFNMFVREVGNLARSSLASYSKEQEETVPFYWVNRVCPIAPVRMRAPKKWKPHDPPAWVDGVVFFRRTGGRFSDRGISVRLPLLPGTSQEQTLVWWAIFLDPAVFGNLVLWSEAFRGERTMYPWEREAQDLVYEGRISFFDLPSQPMPKGRIDWTPLIVVTLLFTATFWFFAVIQGDVLFYLMPTILWAAFAVLWLMSRTKESDSISEE